MFVIFFPSPLDLISSSEEGRQTDPGSKNCICKGLSCICCLDFNISFIDLGGPGEKSSIVVAKREIWREFNEFCAILCVFMFSV